MSIIRKTAFPLQRGTAQGQCLFWDSSLKKWVHTETSEMKWDDTNKYLGINTTTPIARLDVRGTGSPTPSFDASGFNSAVVMMDNGTMTATSYPSILHLDTNAYAGVGLGTVYTGNASTIDSVFEKVLVDSEAVSLNPGGASPTIIRFTTNIEATNYIGANYDSVIISGSTNDDGVYAVSAVTTTDVTITDLTGGAVTLTSEAAVATYISMRAIFGDAPSAGINSSGLFVGGAAHTGSVLTVDSYSSVATSTCITLDHKGAAGRREMLGSDWSIDNRGMGLFNELRLTAKSTPYGDAPVGTFYYDTEDGKFSFREASGWVGLSLNYWNRTGTLLSPLTAGDDLDITGDNLIVGNNVTSTSKLNLTNNSYNFAIQSQDTGILDIGFDAATSEIQLLSTILRPTTDSTLDLGDSTHAYKDLYVDTIKGTGGRKTIILKTQGETDPLTTGDGKAYVTIPAELSGFNLVSVGAHVYTVSTSGLPTVAIYNFTDSQDMLSTNITIDANEKDSKDAATPAVINTSYDDVVIGDEIRIDVDVAGTGAKGLEVRLGFQLP